MRTIWAVLALALGLAGFQYLAPRAETFGLFSEGDGKASVQYAVIFLATVGGVIIGSVYRGLRDLKDQRTDRVPKGFLLRRFHSVDMWLGLVASPIVYALLLKASDGISLPGQIILALENGFCALIIIDSFTDKKTEAGSGEAL